jgi:hypothetical protein
MTRPAGDGAQQPKSLRLGTIAPLRWSKCGFQDHAPGEGIPGPNLPDGAVSPQLVTCGGQRFWYVVCVDDANTQ